MKKYKDQINEDFYSDRETKVINNEYEIISIVEKVLDREIGLESVNYLYKYERISVSHKHPNQLSSVDSKMLEASWKETAEVLIDELEKIGEYYHLGNFTKFNFFIAKD